MVITYHGLSFFKIQFGDRVLAFNPPSKDSSYKSSRFGADIALSSIRHEDFSGGDLLTAGDKEPFEITGPGEYEVQGIFVQGFPSHSSYGDEERINTIYLVELEGMNICNLGVLDTKELPAESSEAIDEIDILFTPIGGDGVLTPSEAYKMAVNLEPHVIIPSLYEGVSDEVLEKFLKEAGADDIEPEEKLTLKPRDVSGKEGEIRVLKRG